MAEIRVKENETLDSALKGKVCKKDLIVLFFLLSDTKVGIAEYRICRMTALEFLHAPGHRIHGIFPGCAGLPVIVFFNEPVNILFHPHQIVAHQLQNRGIEPFQLAVGQFFLCKLQKLCKMVDTESLAGLHFLPEFRILDQHEEGGIVSG